MGDIQITMDTLSLHHHQHTVQSQSHQSQLNTNQSHPSQLSTSHHQSLQLLQLLTNQSPSQSPNLHTSQLLSLHQSHQLLHTSQSPSPHQSHQSLNHQSPHTSQTHQSQSQLNTAETTTLQNHTSHQFSSLMLTVHGRSPVTMPATQVIVPDTMVFAT